LILLCTFCKLLIFSKRKNLPCFVAGGVLEFLQGENVQRRLAPTFFAQSIYILYAEGFALL
jgi:hypothetical protein